MHKSKHGDRITAVTLRLYAGKSDDLTIEAQKIFEERITRHNWELREDGALLSATHKAGESILAFAIDTEDPLTVKTSNQLPRYFAHKMNIAELPGMRLKVLAYPPDGCEFPYWTFDENNDAILFTETGIFVETVRNMWDVTVGIL